MRKSLLIACLPLLLIAAECAPKNPSGDKKDGQSSSREVQFEAQRNFLELEREAIEAYISDRKLNMRRSGTGLYYEAMLHDSVGRAGAQSGDLVLFNYEIALLNGRVLYTSEEDGPRNLKIDRQDAELGLHELLKLMRAGDKALFILPSHLAFGVAGDQNEVPPRTPLAYEVELLKIEKPE